MEDKIWGLLKDGEEFVSVNGDVGVYRKGNYAMDTGGRYFGVYDGSNMRDWTGTGYSGKVVGNWVTDWGSGAGQLRRVGDEIRDLSGHIVGYVRKKD